MMVWAGCPRVTTTWTGAWPAAPPEFTSMSTTEVRAGNDNWVAGTALPAAGDDATGRTPVREISPLAADGVCTAAPPWRRRTAIAAIRATPMRLDPMIATG